MSETMDNLHIPPEVVEAAAKALAKGYNGGHTHHLLFMDEARAAIRAALAAWVECGMAREGAAWQAAIRDQHSWLADTDLVTPNGTFPVLILRTEAST